MADDILKTSLLINGQSYKIAIPRDEEYFYRQAVKQINDTINKYRMKELDADSERLLAMAAFEISYKNIVMKDQNDTQPFVSKIKQWEQDIEKHLMEKEDK